MSHRIDSLLAALLENELSADDHAALCEQLQSDDDLRRRAVRLMLVDSLLADAYPPAVRSLSHKEFSIQNNPPRKLHRRARHYSGIAAAIALALTAWFVSIFNMHSAPDAASLTPPSVAMLSDLSDDAVFTVPGNDQLPIRLGDNLPAGLIQFTTGRAQLMFTSTAVVDLTGPCTFEMIGPSRGRLADGRLEAYVSDRAHGFTVDLPWRMSVVDLGTRYGVEVDKQKFGHVMVTEGRVLVVDQKTSETLTVHQGQMALLNWPGVALRSAPYDPATVAIDPSASNPITRQPARAKIGTLALNAKRVADRFMLTRIPPALEGLPTLTLPRTGSIHQPGAGFSFMLNQPARVYLLVMNRGPHVLYEWTRTGDVAAWRTHDNKNYTDSIYYRDFQAGLVVVPPHVWHNDLDEYGIAHLAVIQSRDSSLNSHKENQP